MTAYRVLVEITDEHWTSDGKDYASAEDAMDGARRKYVAAEAEGKRVVIRDAVEESRISAGETFEP